MKKKSRKTTTKPWALGTVSLLALGFCAGASLQGAEYLQSDCSPKGNTKAARNVQHELVPHVVLPETIQYNKTAKSHRAHPGLDSAGDYGMVSPYVATYVPFPSYQLPMAAQLRPVNQSVYPVSPPIPKTLPLPKKDESVDMEITLEKKDSSNGDTDVAPILLTSSREEVVHATPVSDLNNEVTQTGIFCQKPAKPPAAWSFSSPIFKAASVPMGWGTPGFNGTISQYGPRGCQTQVGFTPMGADGMQQPGMMPYPPQRTFQMGPGAGNPNGPQIQALPNGMLMVTMPPDHARCGLFRCRCGNQPRTMFLPAGPGGMPGAMPGMMPEPQPAADPQSMMMYGMPGMMAMNPMGMNSMGMGMMNVGYGQQPMMNPAMAMQPQMMPVTTMTPYGPMVVGYRPSMNPMMGVGMMQAAYAQQMQQQQMQMLQQQWAQYEAMQRQAMEGGKSADDSKDEVSAEPKAPLPINSPIANPMMAGMMPGMMANPFGMYSQQVGADGQPKAQDAAGDAEAMCPMMGGMTSPMMMFSNPMMMQPMMPQGGMSGMYMTPYGMMAMNPMGGMGMNPMGMNSMGMGYGMMNPMMPGMMNVGYGAQPMMNQGGMNMSDVIQLVMLLNNNKQDRRRGLFARWAERREARRERRHGGMDDPLAQLMQAWSTPYSPADSIVRMPSRNAYPYGFFGAQVGPQDTANYGGYYNLYMGNTSYPGLY